MFFNDTNLSTRYPLKDLAVRVQPVWQKVALVVLTATACAAAGCSAPPKGTNDMNVTKIDDQALTTLVQCFTEVERVEHSWGWLKWLMNDKIDPKAEMTFGLVQINSGQENPLHTHPNCEEILYMLSGSCEHRIGDKTVMLEAGQMIRIPTGVPHRAKTAGSEPMRAVIVYSSGDRQFVLAEQ